jgi:peptidoglycan/xylan/chitin deacetylase (PgdA/CDA1 family)/glycosyltransferase involved in cell wall biosynthesis
MNILMALSQLEVTGAEVYATQLADQLCALGYGVTIVSDTLTKATVAEYIPIPFNKRSFVWRMRNIRALVHIIRERHIHVVHAHSRASAWCAAAAAAWCGIPLITTVHGRQPARFSRKFVKAFGVKALAICEAVRDNLVHELGVKAARVEIVRNGVQASFDESLLSPLTRAGLLRSQTVASSDAVYDQSPLPPLSRGVKTQDSLRVSGFGGMTYQHSKPSKTVTLIGRLSNQKGGLTREILRHALAALPEDVTVRVVGGDRNGVPATFDEFRKHVEFTGYVDNVADYIAASDVVIAAGRSAIESVLLEKPTIACGEARLHGLVRLETLPDVLRTNFGDIDARQHFDWTVLERSLNTALHLDVSTAELHALAERVKAEFSLQTLTDRIDATFQSVYVQHCQHEIPILTYHRVVERAEDGGTLPIWVTVAQLNEHFSILKEQGFTPITIADLAVMRRTTLSHRFDADKRYVVLTFDDGYEDNYTLLFPLLDKYGFTATIFLVAGETHSVWDKAHGSVHPLLIPSQVREMQHYGIDFGAHTMTHVRLADVPGKAAEHEIYTAKQILEERLGTAVESLCYPYGSFNADVKDCTEQAGYSFGIASDAGPFALHEDAFAVRRIGVFPNTNGRGFRRKIAGDYGR